MDMHVVDIYEHRIGPERKLRTGKCKQDSMVSDVVMETQAGNTV